MEGGDLYRSSGMLTSSLTALMLLMEKEIKREGNNSDMQRWCSSYLRLLSIGVGDCYGRPPSLHSTSSCIPFLSPKF